MVPENDIFSLHEGKIKEILSELELNLADLPSISSNEFKTTEINLPRDNYGKEIRENLEPLAQKAEKEGFGHNIYTGLYEAVKNAHEHGNKFDPNKKILISQKFNQNNLEIIIADEGQKLPKFFVPFILAHREKNVRNGGFINWYEFSGGSALKGRDNLGQGTSFLHTYLDKVRYFRSEETNGLAIYLLKNKL